uniref:Uncharacterized protein n=1 Tax=Cacopsylla melanoneura TaxID=428564 RepID=A0A8D9F5J6_9HEMI
MRKTRYRKSPALTSRRRCDLRAAPSTTQTFASTRCSRRPCNRAEASALTLDSQPIPARHRPTQTRPQSRAVEVAVSSRTMLRTICTTRRSDKTTGCEDFNIIPKCPLQKHLFFST